MKIVFTFFFSCILTVSAFAQEIVLHGRITDESNRPIPFCTLNFPALGKKFAANQLGDYSAPLAKEFYLVKISMIGYQSLEQTINVNDTTKINFKLQEQTKLNEVIVSASRKTETIDEVPSSITIIGSKELAIQKTINNNLSDILANSVPGMGFNTNRTSNLGQTMRGRGILVMIDGVPQSTPLRNGARDIRAIDPAAIERIEVIKGATSIYGNGADGGLINYVTKRPDTINVISGQTSIGTSSMLAGPKNTYGFQASQLFSGTIKKFDYVISGRYEKTGLYKDANGEVLSPEYGLNDLKMWNAFTKIGYNFNAKTGLN